MRKEEKKYLENVIRPFKDRVDSIVKLLDTLERQFIRIRCGSSLTDLPRFDSKKDTMYKGMELDKEYTLKELGLFEGE